MLFGVGDLRSPTPYKRKVVDIMKKVPVELIPALLAEEENIRELHEFMRTFTAPPKDMIAEPKTVPYLDCSYKKGHDVPEGIYTVKILDIKCHTATAYRMKLELLDTKEKGKVILGYGERWGSDFLDLADCFGEEPVFHKKSTGYIGEVGKVHLTHSGWIQPMPRNLF